MANPVLLTFSNDPFGKFLLNGSVYVDYDTGIVYADANETELAFVAVTNTHSGDTFAYSFSRFHHADGQYKITFGPIGSGENITVAYTGSSPQTLDNIKYNHNGHTFQGGQGDPVACFCAGTQIGTGGGTAAVETLAVGDMVVTASGALRPITWIGHRRVDTAQHPMATNVWPVRISAGAFGEGLPERDLWLSPDHCIAAEGALIPVKALLNGTTVVQQARLTVDYWHVELASHDVILAEGLPVESYLDTGNRAAFEGGAAIDLHPDFAPRHWTQTCVPMAFSGPAVEAVKARLLACAAAVGHHVTAASDLHILADGRRIEPIACGVRRFAFALPAGCADIALVSRTFVPARMRPGSTDGRSLGLCVGRLQIDGADQDLRDLPADGWNEVEELPGYVQRWTTGRTALPAQARIVILDLAGEGTYWIERRDNVVTLAA